jgi:hypothetical protein
VIRRGSDVVREPPEANAPTRDEPRAAVAQPAVLSWTLFAASAAVAGAWVFLAAAHVRDRYRLDQVSGVRIALARWFDSGTLYPPLYDGTHVGGTRIMPLPIVLHGALARLTGEYVVSGKLLAYASAVALVAVVLVLLRRLGCPPALSIGLALVLVTTNTGFSGALDLRADLLPLLLQLLAVWLVAERRSRASTLGAALVAAFAFVAKLSAVWAPIAIVAWLILTDRRRAARFAAAYAVAAVALVGVFALWSGGRIFENVIGLSTSGVTVRSILGAPFRFVQLLASDATTAWALVPFAALGVWSSISSRRISIWALALLASVVVLLVVLLDVGTGWNQLVDPVVLVVVVVGELVGRSRRGEAPDADAPPSLVARAVPLAVLWILATGLVVLLLPQVRATVAGSASYRLDPLAGVATTNTTVLSEDPYVPVSLGQTPVVLDPFMLPRVGRRIPAAVDDIVRRIRARDFDIVVLVEPLNPVDRSWWNEEDLGPAVVRAIADSYRFDGRAQGYYLYVPKDRSA